LFTVALLAAAYLRFEALGEPSYWLDEILGETLTDAALAQPWWHWITGVDREHGPLYYATQFASRLAGRDETAGRFPAALFGLLTIPLIFLITRAIDERAAIVAALLLAISPLHVYYSREARPYGLLIFLTAVLLLALLRGWRRIAVVAVIALLYTSAPAAPVIAAAAVAAWIARDRRLAGFAIVATMLVPVLYRGKPWASASNAFPEVDLSFFAKLLRIFTVTALGDPFGERIAMLMLALAIAGAIVLGQRDRRTCAIVLTMTIAPTLFAIVPLWYSGHFFAPRYVAPSLIGFLVLVAMAFGVRQRQLPLSSAAERRPRTSKAVAGATALQILAVVAVIAIAVPNWNTARREPFQKLDWRMIAATLRARVHSGDVIACAQPYSYLSLRHYLRDLPPDVHFVLLDFVPAVEKPMWLVHSGYSTDVSHWMCRYPLLLASPLEGFRLHYAPSLEAFLLERSVAAEQRAVAIANGFFFGEGWAGAEDSFRWATGLRATLTVPQLAPRDRVIRFRAYPLTHAALPPQTLRITLNGAPVTTLTLAPEWRDYAVRASAERWREGINEIAFEFSRATAPAAVDPQSSDRRELAASFDGIAFDDASSSELFTVRLATESFLDARTAWRNHQTRLRLHRENVEPLLARLGFDPRTAWPQIERGEVALEDVAETIAYGSCEDARGFLRRAFAILLERQPNAEEERSLAGLDRVVAVGRIVKSEEFRRRYAGSTQRTGDQVGFTSLRSSSAGSMVPS